MQLSLLTAVIFVLLVVKQELLDMCLTSGDCVIRTVYLCVSLSFLFVCLIGYHFPLITELQNIALGMKIRAFFLNICYLFFLFSDVIIRKRNQHLNI